MAGAAFGDPPDARLLLFLGDSGGRCLKLFGPARDPYVPGMGPGHALGQVRQWNVVAGKGDANWTVADLEGAGHAGTACPRVRGLRESTVRAETGRHSRLRGGFAASNGEQNGPRGRGDRPGDRGGNRSRRFARFARAKRNETRVVHDIAAGC